MAVHGSKNQSGRKFGINSDSLPVADLRVLNREYHKAPWTKKYAHPPNIRVCPTYKE